MAVRTMQKMFKVFCNIFDNILIHKESLVVHIVDESWHLQLDIVLFYNYMYVTMGLYSDIVSCLIFWWTSFLEYGNTEQPAKFINVHAVLHYILVVKQSKYFIPSAKSLYYATSLTDMQQWKQLNFVED